MDMALKQDEQKVQEAIKTEEKEEDLSRKTLTELKNLAKEANIKGYSTMKKDELIASLSK